MTKTPQLPTSIEELDELATEYFIKSDHLKAQYYTISDFLEAARAEGFREGEKHGIALKSPGRQMYQAGLAEGKREERERIHKNVGQLRQWLNETQVRPFTNEHIETWLELTNQDKE